MKKPWNDPTNVAITRTEVPTYCCRNDSYTTLNTGAISSYFAVTGKETAWSAMDSTEGSVGDNPSQTILLIEKLDQGVTWVEPKDLTFVDAMKVLTSPIPPIQIAHIAWGEYSFFLKSRPQKQALGFHVAFADGSVRFVTPPISKKLARSLLTANGGEVITNEEFQYLWEPELDYLKIYSLSLFAAISLIPILRMRKYFKKEEVV